MIAGVNVSDCFWYRLTRVFKTVVVVVFVWLSVLVCVIDCLERLVFEITHYVSSRMLKSTRSLFFVLFF